MKKHTLLMWMCVFCLMFALTACGSDDDDGNNSNNEPSGEVGETASQTITAADGGTLELPSGAAKLTVPADALDEDLELSVTSIATTGLPDADNLGSLGFEFGPDGTTFSTPVTIELAFEGTVPDDHKAVLAVLEDGAWTEVEGSALDGKKVVGETDHFSTYIILFVGDTASLITTECADFEFTACGGDMTGTWKVKDICIEMGLFDNPFADTPECQDSVYAATFDWDGIWEINSDGTLSVSNFSYTSGVDIVVTSACLDAYFPGVAPAESCEGIADDELTCAFADDTCTCETEPETKVMVESVTGTWSVDGTTMTSELDEGGDGPSSSEYCVDGNIATSEFDMGDGEGYIIFEKQ